jgi:hypothetical protein
MVTHPQMVWTAWNRPRGNTGRDGCDDVWAEGVRPQQRLGLNEKYLRIGVLRYPHMTQYVLGGYLG